MSATRFIIPVFLLAGLAACGSSSESEPAAPAEAGVAEAPSAADEAPAAADPMAQDAAAVPAAFMQCRSCHAVEAGKNLIGPSLAGVFGAKAGHVAEYNYSTAMKDSGLTWDEATLDAFLKAPRETVAGTKMSYAGLKDDAQRAEVIGYLKTL